MRILGNRQRMIKSYRYLFEQFVTVNKLEYVEDITVESLYHYSDVLEVKPTPKVNPLKINESSA